MSAKFIISDTHFSHEKIIEYCKRPFASVEEMDEVMIKNWNDVVRNNDIVYHLGDFSFYKGDQFFERLNGRKTLIRGNHDDESVFNLPWESQHDLLEVNHKGKRLIMCHFPLEAWHKSSKGSLHFHGHVHNTPYLNYRPNRFNVSAEMINYTPALLESFYKKALNQEELAVYYDTFGDKKDI